MWRLVFRSAAAYTRTQRLPPHRRRPLTATSPYVLVERDGHIVTVTLNKPARLNAFTMPERTELAETFARLNQDPEVRVAIITGAGRAFCAGADVVSQAIGASHAGQNPRERFIEPQGAFILPIYNFERPLIAAVNGAAAGAGFSIAMASDIRIASSSARFLASWVDRGMVADAGASYLLPRLTGLAPAMALALTGGSLDAQEALRLGLVSRVVEPEALLSTARTIAEAIAAKPPVAVAHIKRNLRLGAASTMEQALLIETAAQRACLQTEDLQEAIRAFKEKRPGVYKGR